VTSLFDRHQLGELTLPNRVVMAPMTRVRATADGRATASMATYYAQRATAGLIVTEGVQPNRVGRSNPGTPGLVTEEHVAACRPVTDAVHINGGRVFAQIMHGGRVSHPDTTGLQPVGPSAVAATGEVFTPTGPRPAPVPRALDTAEVPEHNADHWLARGADLISFGRAFIGNPDLVERLRAGLPIAEDNQDTWYQGGNAGYLDYPAYHHAA
jgi:N-ethylmaleimide reductase